MDPFLADILDTLRTIDKNDTITRCDVAGIDDIPGNATSLLSIADARLHVFPFKTVNPCWFRLYTDASIAKAVRIMQDNEENLMDLNGSLATGALLDEVVAALDMALIMAGGLGREQMIHDIFERLRSKPQSSQSPSRKRKRSDTQDNDSSLLPHLPEGITSLPKIRSPIESRKRPSLSWFEDFMHKARQPIILTDTLDHWPAMKLWKSRKYWLDETLGGRRLVPIEVGRSYTDDDWGQTIVPFKRFLEKHIYQDPGTDVENDNNSPGDNPIGYLAQHDLLKQIPALRNTIAIPDYCFLDPPLAEPGTPVATSKSKGANLSHPTTIPATYRFDSDRIEEGTDTDQNDVQCNIWFGPTWTISPLHHDPYHNILCQVVGKKYVRLYSPAYSQQLYPRREDEPAPHLIKDSNLHTDPPKAPTIDMSNTSTIDIAAMEVSPDEDWDEVYPGISTLPHSECILEPGDALYIPIGWWHYVRSCSVGISASFWW